MVEHPNYPPTLGAKYLGNGKCRFLVWAPRVKHLDLKLLESPERLLSMRALDRGYFELETDGVEPGTRYVYRLDDKDDRPDPASRFQPAGVHRASAVVDSEFGWSDQHWHGIPLHQYITYELHIGTFSSEGTFDAVIRHLDALQDLGVTAIELMPVAQFPGDRNWGYDGVHPFSVQNTYGGPDGLKRLVDAAHARNLAVVMDVVYNHLGPEGNYLAEFGDYFTDQHHTPWGNAVNFADRGSDEVRRFFIENALCWIDEFHIDALRLDAVHAIFDSSARPFLQQLADAVRLEGERLNRHVFTIAETNLNDPRMITPKEQGGIGVDGQWCDDLHHAFWTEVSDERLGHYADFDGFADIVKTYRDGFVLRGEYSKYRGRRHGTPVRHVEPIRMVVYSQNHDRISNRLRGERLSELVSGEQLKLAAALVILSPFQPMLFMGEEYGERAPFLYFISHGDLDLVESVRRGRQEEFARYRWTDEPPDPQDVATFQQCKLNHELAQVGPQRTLRDFYKRLIFLRKTCPSLAFPDRERMEITVLPGVRAMAVNSWSAAQQLYAVFHFGKKAASVTVDLARGRWSRLVDSADEQWNGPGGNLPRVIESGGQIEMSLAPHSVVVFQNDSQ